MIYDSNDIPASLVTVSENPAPKQNISDLAELKYSGISAKTPTSTLYNFVAIDIETTGLSVSKNEIIEVSAVRFRNGRAVEKFLTFTYPKRGIQPDALSVNGITESMVAGSPIFPCIAASLEEFIGNDNIVGHNLEFDLKFLYKYGVNFLKQKRRYYDTLKIVPKVLKRPKKKWDQDLESSEIDYESDYDVDDYKLSTLCDYYNIEMLDSHRAADDCYATGLLFIQLGVEYGAIADPLEAEAKMRRVLSDAQAPGQTPTPRSTDMSVASSAPASQSITVAETTLKQPQNPTPAVPAYAKFLSKVRWFSLAIFFVFLIAFVRQIIAGQVLVGIVCAIIAALCAAISLKGFQVRDEEDL